VRYTNICTDVRIRQKVPRAKRMLSRRFAARSLQLADVTLVFLRRVCPDSHAQFDANLTPSVNIRRNAFVKQRRPTREGSTETEPPSQDQEFCSTRRRGCNLFSVGDALRPPRIHQAAIEDGARPCVTTENHDLVSRRNVCWPSFGPYRHDSDVT